MYVVHTVHLPNLGEYVCALAMEFHHRNFRIATPRIRVCHLIEYAVFVCTSLIQEQSLRLERFEVPCMLQDTSCIIARIDSLKP